MSRGVTSTESPEPGYIVVFLTVLVPNPIPAPSTFLSLASSPHFSHPHGICRHFPTTLSVELFRCLYHPMPLHYFFFWLSTNTHIRFLAVHRILRWIIIGLVLHILKPLGSFLDMN